MFVFHPQLDGMDASLVRLRKPLVEAADRLGAVSAAIAIRKAEVAATQDEAATVAAKSAALEALCDAQEAVADATAAAARYGGGAHTGGLTGGGGSLSGGPLSSGVQEGGGLAAAMLLQRAASLCERARTRVSTALAAVAAVTATTSSLSATKAAAGTVPSSTVVTLIAPLGGTGAGAIAAGATSTTGSISVLSAAVNDSLTELLRELKGADAAVGVALLAALRTAISDAASAAATPATVASTKAPSSSPALPHDDAGTAATLTLIARLHALFSGLSLLSRCADAEEAVSAGLTRPLFSSLFTPGRVDDGARGSFRGLGRACDDALGAISAPTSPFCGIMLEAAVSGGDGRFG